MPKRRVHASRGGGNRAGRSITRRLPHRNWRRMGVASRVEFGEARSAGSDLGAPGALPGVEVVACTEGCRVNRGGPSARRSPVEVSDSVPPYKADRNRRQSSGSRSRAYYPVTRRTTQPAVGKARRFGRVGGGGTDEGMAQANHPTDKVRQLQRRLYLAAKRSPKRRFHALYDRIARRDVLARAWEQVRQNRGAAGVDGETIAEAEAYGVDRLLTELREQLETHRYRPRPLRRVFIQADGKSQRPLGIPRVGDRILQAAAKLVLEPIFEASFRPCADSGRIRSPVPIESDHPFRTNPITHSGVFVTL